jgi:predicted dehydrogenase
MRIGILGSGFMAGVHLDSWSRTPAHISGIHSLDNAGAARLAAAHGTQAYASITQLLEDVDVVDICTPTYVHHDHVLAAAAQGKHIICEKPLALTIADGVAMIEACGDAGVSLLIAHVVRFFPEYAAAQQIVSSGDIGQPAIIRLSRCSAKPQTAITDSWFHDEARSGGMILDLMVHDYDYARWIAGEVKSVFARSVTGQRPDAPLDYAIVTLTHANGALSNIEGSWALPAGMFRTSLEIAGSAGLIEHPAGNSTPLEAWFHHLPAGEAPAISVPASPMLEDPYTAEIRHFYDVLSSGSTPRVTAHDALAALAIGLAAIESARTGRPVAPAYPGALS